MGRSATKVYENLGILDISTDGLGVCKSGDRVFFIPGTVPGDVIDAETWKARSKFWTGKVLRFHSFSEKRTDPACSHFGSCGGCKWQNMKYEAQLEFKYKMVKDALERIGDIHTEILPIVPSKNIYRYRNRLDFSFSNRRWFTDLEMGTDRKPSNDALGFHVPRMFDRVIDITGCHLMDHLNDELRNNLRDFAFSEKLSFYDHRLKSGLLRGLILRTTTTGESMVIVMFGEADEEKINSVMEFLRNSFPGITSLLFVINTKHNDTIYDLDVKTFAGKGYITEEMEGLKFKVGPKSFYQTNPLQAYELYKTAREFAGIQKTDTVYDLYSGTGTIANFVAQQAKHVVGVESVTEAIEAAKENSTLNGIVNTSFHAGDMQKVFTPAFIQQNGTPDVIITDPPRAGMDKDTCRLLLELEVPRIVYVSCNPATQARDLKILAEKYRVVKSQPVDMFPQTSHVENVILAELK